MKSISTLFRQLSLIVVLISAFSLSVWGTEETATLTFNDKSKRTTFTTTQQVWTENGITLTNNKAKSTTNVADYADPARFYKSSEIIISIGDLGKIKQIVFDCNNESYASAMSNSIDNTTTISSDKVTLTLDGTSNTYTIPSLSGGQVRMDALTVTYENGEEPSIPTETLNTPSNITTKPKSQSIEVTWDAVTETNEGTAVSSVTYTLYYNNDTKLGSTTENSYEITELVPNTSYTFKIEASKTDFITSEKQIFTATTTTNTVANISEFIQREDKNELTITGAVTVIAQSSDQTHTWIQDETGAIMMTSYDVKKEYLEGNKITNLKGKYEYKYDVAQLTPTELPEATIGDAVSAEPISITDATNYVHKKVTLSNLKCTTITQDNELILSDGTDEIETYENYFEFDFTSVIEQSKFDVTAIVGKFYSTIQLYIISIDNIVLPKMYTVNFHTSENEFESYNVVENTTLNNMPSEPTSCDNTYSKFIGWTTSTTTDGTVQPELFNLESTITSNLNLYPVFAKTEGTGETESTWTLVTDESTLAVGDQVVIVAKDYNYALSTEQKSNNRGQAAVTKNNDIITLGANVQILTLEAGTKDGTFAFNTGSGYLYAASSSSNYLRTQKNNNDNGSWEITITNGTASIVAQGTNTRNTMQYNQSSSLFACYGSASQKAIALYKLIEEQAGEATAWIICYIPTNNIIIESGNSLDINKTTKCNTLTIKSNLDEAGEVNVTAGALNANNIVIEKTIDASRWFFFSLPFDCNVDDIVATYVNGGAELEYAPDASTGDYVITEYKGGWVELIGKSHTLNANQGYIIGHFGSGDVTVKFPSNGAQNISAPANATLAKTSDNGFNLIGLPYYQKVNASLNNVNHLSIPNEDGETYNQTEDLSLLASIAPFTSFFVQTEAENIEFTLGAQQNAAPRLDGRSNRASLHKAVVTLTDANGGADKTTIINNPSKTTDYEIGHDLTKLIGYAEIPQIYSLQGDEMLAFNSLAIDNSTVIPLGVYAHADGDYTFSLSEKSVGDLEGWELYDNETGKTTRLANEELTVNLAQGTHEGRFEIRLQQRISTDCDNTMGDMTTWTANGTLNINNLPADAVVYIYDAVGRMVYVANNNSTTFNYTFAVRGVYNIVVRTAENSVSFKTIY